MQVHVIDTADRFNVLVAGRRFGKDVLFEYLTCTTIALGGAVGILFPTYRNLDRFWNEIKKRLGNWTGEDEATKSDQVKTLTFSNGARLVMYSLRSIDDARGEKFNLFIFNEAGEIATHVNLIDTVWNEIVRHTLLDYKGSAWFGGTPKGTANDFYRLFKRGNSPQFPAWRSWQLPTMDNPHIDPDEIQSMIRDEGMSDASIAQEIQASFVEPRGQLFSNLNDVLTAVLVDGWSHGMQVVGGMDFGGSHDYHCLSLWDARTRRELFIDRFKASSKTLVAKRVARTLSRYKVRRFLCEQNSRGLLYMQEIAEHLDANRAKEAYTVDSSIIEAFATSNASKVAIIEDMVDGFDSRSVRLLPDEDARAELVTFAELRTTTGMVTYGCNSRTGHDDTVIARALGLRAAKLEMPDDVLNGNSKRITNPYRSLSESDLKREAERSARRARTALPHIGEFSIPVTLPKYI